MTLPDERYRAVVQTEKFLKDLISTPRVPKQIKDQARYLLRHYPSEWDMKTAARLAESVFAERMEPVTRMFAQYQQGLQPAEINAPLASQCPPESKQV